MEAILSGRSAGVLHAAGDSVGDAVGDAVEDGGRHAGYDPGNGVAHVGSGMCLGSATVSSASSVAFAELHASSSSSFLRGASDPEVMVSQAVRLGITALACVDRDGFYGAPRYAAAAAEAGVATIFGAELSLDGVDSPPLTVLCRDPEGYRRLSRLIAKAHMADREKGVVMYPSMQQMARAALDKQGQCHWLVLVDAGMLPRAEQIIEAFGSQHCVVELRHIMQPDDSDYNEALHAIALRRGVREIISARPTCATPQESHLAQVKHALRERSDLRTSQPRAHPAGGSWLRSGEEMLRLAGDCSWLKQAVATTVHVAAECAFSLNLIAPQLPHFPVPKGHTEMSWLRHLTYQGAHVRYGSRSGGGKTSPAHAPQRGVHASPQAVEGQTDAARGVEAWEIIEHELDTIEALGFPGYFLIVHDIVRFCHSANILCQGRGSAANSAVCFALGITTVDAVAAGLLFERFLSPERDGPPDIDIDIESGRREEVIQYVYSRYGRDYAAQVANVITYRTKGALRDAARALGYAPGQVDAWSRGTEEPPQLVQRIAEQLRGHPRHLGIHSGGMVICDRPIADVVPTEWARKENRSVLQWDKDDCATVGLVKFDLLGLGMLEAIHHAIDQIHTHRGGRRIELWRLQPVEKEVYEMLCRADALGVFQVESRAQLNTLPRLKPQTFYDLVIEVSLIRPGPIQGGSVHPYLRRRNGTEPVTYAHPCLKPALEKTLGIPLFQEQLMRLVVDAAGFSAAEADTLRRAMGSKRSPEKINQLRQRFYDGLRATNNITGEIADRLWEKIMAFASYGFPESHAQSFASLVYYSAWLKYHYPAEFCVALLRAYPMGFYSPQSLISDARRHGVDILPVDINQSDVCADTVIETRHPNKERQCIDKAKQQSLQPHNQPQGLHGLGRGTAEPVGAIRLGLASIRGIGEDTARSIVETRQKLGAYTSISDLSREAGLSVSQIEHLARAGALETLGLSRRQSLWTAGIAATERAGMLPGTSCIHAPSLPGMSTYEVYAADLASTGVTPRGHPVELLREFFTTWHQRPVRSGVRAGQIRGGAAVVAADELLHVPDGTRVRVAGAVTHRQKPMTAGGAVFLGIEDETGIANVMLTPGLWKTQRVVAMNARMIIVRGIVHNATGAASITADLLEPVDEDLVAAGIGQAQKLVGRSRDFR